MSSLTDLRSTLDRHADAVDDAEATARLTAVHHRVAAVRRRRRAAGAGGLALVVLGGLATAVFPRQAGETLPAAPVVLGDQAPTTMTSLGYTYRTDGQGKSFGRSGSVKVSESDEPQLFSWTTDGSTRVRVSVPGDGVWHSQQTGFHDYVVVPPGTAGRLTISTGEGRVGVARYVLTDVAPDGYTRDGVTYRQTAAGRHLLGAVIAAPGETEASMSVVAAAGRNILTAPLCTGMPRGYDVTVTIDGKTAIQGGCDDGSSFDPGGPGGYIQALGKVSQTLTVRVYVSRRADPAVPAAGSFPSLRLGVGLYGTFDQPAVNGQRIDPVIEHGGHTWGLSRIFSSKGAPVRIPAADQDRVAWLVWGAEGTVRATFGTDGMPPQGGTFSGGPAGIGDLWIPAGARATAELAHGKGPFSVAVYTRAD